jgi:hypothetical protein
MNVSQPSLRRLRSALTDTENAFCQIYGEFGAMTRIVCPCRSPVSWISHLRQQLTNQVRYGLLKTHLSSKSGQSSVSNVLVWSPNNSAVLNTLYKQTLPSFYCSLIAATADVHLLYQRAQLTEQYFRSHTCAFNDASKIGYQTLQCDLVLIIKLTSVRAGSVPRLLKTSEAP